MLKQVAYLFAGSGAAAILPFIRSILIARMISVEDFGVATTFILVLAMVEMITNLSYGRLIVQAQEGDGVVFQGSLQSLHFLRGLLNAIVMLAVAQSLADFLQVSDAAWAFQVLAICPLLRGLSHFDILRDQRNMKFSSTALATATPPLVSLATAFVLVFFFKDYRLMLWAIIAQEVTYVILSHVVANRAYRLHWDFDVIKAAFSFGLPLLGSSMLMFFNFQGDRLVVGNQLGPEVLGWYSVAFLLIATPSLSIANTYQILALPPLSRRQTHSNSFRKQANLTLEGILFVSSLCVLGVSLVGPTAVILIFGSRYEAALTILVFFSISQALRLFRAGLFIVLIARARTNVVFYTSLIRFVAFPCGFFALVNGHGIPALLACNILGELAAVGFALAHSHRMRFISLRKLTQTLLFFILFMGICFVDALTWPPSADLQSNIHFFQLVLILSFLVFASSLHSGRQFIMETVLPELSTKYLHVRRRGKGQ